MNLPDIPEPLSLSVQKLNVTIAGQQRLSNINIEVSAGSALGIMSPLHAGTSELLWAINRLLPEVSGVKMSGHILVGGTNINQVPLSLLRQRVGLLIPVPLARTPYGEVATALRAKVSSAHTDDLVEKAMRRAGIWRQVRDSLHQEYNHDDPILLRLLCLARTLALNPGLLLLDDPTRGLDILGRARFEEVILKAMTAGDITLVWGTREPDQAGRVADKVAFLCAGEIVETGHTRSLFEHPVDPRTESFLTGDYRSLSGAKKVVKSE